jgi:hypothetical protein
MVKPQQLTELVTIRAGEHSEADQYEYGGDC